jgi:hypothetical protein
MVGAVMVTPSPRPMQPGHPAGGTWHGAGFETLRKTSWRALLLGAPPRLG